MNQDKMLNFITSNDNNALFSVQPYLDNDGTLHYTAAANAYGLANVSIQLHDDGGTANGGIDTSLFQVLAINVGSINDMYPVLLYPTTMSASIEDAGAQTVAE